MSVIVQIVIAGLIIGAIARLLLPGRDPIGFLGTLGVGVGGAFLGWWVGRSLVSARSVHQHPWLWAIGGAIVVLLVIRAAASRRGLIGRRRWGW
jgi:uncharacterized membrane protein YeaQ/YmgE (transglycosylase-associated protein family)